jgi:hypothetical protein
MIIFGASTANFGLNRVTQLVNRLNDGNPNYNVLEEVAEHDRARG